MTPSLTLQSPAHGRLTSSAHGAQVLGWSPVGAGEALYVSPQSAPQAGKSVRGGVPVIFPQFAAQGPLTRHGLVRTRAWQLVQERSDTEGLMAVWRIEDDAQTRAEWPYAFALELTAFASGKRLELELAVENRGDVPFDFQAALHTYLRVGDVAACALEGARDLRYFDSLRQQEGVQHSARLEFLNGKPVDRIVYGLGESPLVLWDYSGEHTRSIGLEHQGFADAVIWNPGEGHDLADLPVDGWRHMLCVEAAQIEQPVHLPAGEEWLGRQRITLA